MAKPNEVDRLLDQIVIGKSPEELLGRDGVLKELTKRLVERALEDELTTHLGYEKHAAEGRNTGNACNGATTKGAPTGAGELDIEVRRARTAEFEPQLVKKWQRRLTGFDDNYIDGADLSSAVRLLAQAPGWFVGYSHHAPHSALGYRSPVEYRRVTQIHHAETCLTK